ncbi:MAG: bifunctional diaminohydroxyphosphoribosylaminopyrimidine deaminase/5-amino-6-(5-phosphoribosylamino)uracil reductase RibD [Deltaproteobacteria bacterium]|nr:bifunctional diaminohydroxyphosphoribosylaminopyrimidine deaminase/5-amino-6-(5-phosphoribosylamino)uracil reductase RibD [Deltaproteobacteria bacterium]
MGVALELARRGIGRTSPNPAVGAVVVREGRIVGRGFHPKPGEPHAEIFALEEAGPLARGAELYVTLEPCSHYGRTPPCIERVVGSGLRRVVVAMEDPNPRVAGAGLRALSAAGIPTTVGVREAEAKALNEAFCLSIRTGRAFLHLKLAATLDGKIATRTGDSRWISSEESRLRVHALRARCGAILVGVGTAVADDPRLTVRIPGEPEKRILRVVLDPSLRAPLALGIFSPSEAPFTAVACLATAEPARLLRVRELGVEVFTLPATPSGAMDLPSLLSALYARGIMEVIAEGGGETARALLEQGVVDRFHAFYAPRLLGGRDSVSMVGGVGPEAIDDSFRVRDLQVERVGSDVYVTGRISQD